MEMLVIRTRNMSAVKSSLENHEGHLAWSCRRLCLYLLALVLQTDKTNTQNGFMMPVTWTYNIRAQKPQAKGT